jgi:hypothetical protein
MILDVKPVRLSGKALSVRLIERFVRPFRAILQTDLKHWATRSTPFNSRLEVS